MKRSIFLFISYFFSLVIHANNGNFVRKEGILYQIQDGREVRINERIITVKFKNEESVLSNDFVIIRKNQLGFIDLSVPDDTDVLKYYSKLKNCGLFEVVNMNNYGETCMMPNDTHIGSQWHLNAIHMFDAWNITTGNANIKVAVIDTEIDWQHPDIGIGSDAYKNIDESLGYNHLFNTHNPVSPHSHGTAVAGVLGAKTNNGFGVCGISGGNYSQGVT